MATSPNTDNYTLGKGIVYLNRLDNDTGLYTGERDLGNAPAFSFNIALEKLPHYSSRGGLKAKDKEIVSQMTPAVTFTLDEINAENFALLTLADVVTVTQAGGAVASEEHKAYLGKRIALDERGISAVTVTDADTGAITYVAGLPSNPLANYQIDTSADDDKIGRILIHADQSGCVAAITDALLLDIAYTSAAVTYTKIKAFAQTQVEGFMRFVSDNPAGGQQELQIWRVSLAPTGDTAMIGDDWSTLGFTGEVLKDEIGHPDSPYMDILMT
jgi:hypothetical protein